MATNEGDSDAWSTHPQFTRAVWILEVTQGYTQRGYRDWVEAQIEESKADGYTGAKIMSAYKGTTKTPISPATMPEQEKYVQGGGNHCPNCGGSNLDADGPQCYEGAITMNCRCMECSSRWEEYYTLKGFTWRAK